VHRIAPNGEFSCAPPEEKEPRMYIGIGTLILIVILVIIFT
jgi:hypothetical protein